MESESVPPSVNLLESMRSVGYSFEAALADLIDNSISAGARNVMIDADVVEGRHVAILDDGAGMSASVAREALRLAGSVGAREESDLGRFGLGLKTASLSQARSLTVVTKRNHVLTALRWDIDFVRDSGQWLLIVLDSTELDSLPLWERLADRNSGTLVVWERLDLLLGDTAAPGTYLAQRLTDVRASLALVFHRFLADKGSRFTIAVNGIALEPVDPFLSDNPRTQRSSPEIIQVGGAEVLVEAFTLPHPSGMRPQDRSRADLGEGMREAQGFYVYRNRRLISHGHWYGLARMSELSKQTRVKVDVPASLDALWQLDIKKSRAEPPHSFKLRLRQLMDPILERGHRVHTFRGRRDDAEVVHLWNKMTTRDGFKYEVNLESPVVRSVLARLDTRAAECVVSLLREVAATFPLLDAYVELAANSPQAEPSIEHETLLERLRAIHETGLLDEDPAAAAKQLAGIEPFHSTNDLKVLVERVWGETK